MGKRKDTNLAEGEVTGHAHRCFGDDVAVYDKSDGERMLDTPNGCEVTHEEHKTVVVDPGQYDIVIAKEFDEVERARNVAD